MTQLLVSVRDKRDRAAFEKLYDFFFPRLRAMLARDRSCSIDIDDLAQDVMIIVWRRATTFDAVRANAATWIYTIARNRKIDVLRGRKLAFVGLNEGLMIADHAPPADLISSTRSEERSLHEAYSRLPEKLRDVLHLMFFQGLSHVEIAKRTGLPVGTVKSRSRAAYAALRRALQADH